VAVNLPGWLFSGPPPAATPARAATAPPARATAEQRAKAAADRLVAKKLDRFISRLERLGESGRTATGNRALNHLRQLRANGNLIAATTYMKGHPIESLTKTVVRPVSAPGPAAATVAPAAAASPYLPPSDNDDDEPQDEWKALEAKVAAPAPHGGLHSVMVISTGKPFYISDGYGSKGYGLSTSSTGNKPLAVVRGYYEGRKAEVHVHLTPSGKKYDAHTGAHIKRKSATGGDQYPVSWAPGNVSGTADLQSILASGFSPWWLPGSYLEKQLKPWL
jgi:hypothetical protein